MSDGGNSTPVRSKKNPLKTNLILAGTLIVVASFAYWFEFKKQPEIKAEKEAAGKLIPIEEDWHWERLTIVSREHGVDFAMACDGNCKLSNPKAKWVINKPIQFKADDGNISSFITQVTAANIENTLELGENAEAELSKFGMGKEVRPTRYLTLKVKDRDKYTVYFGDKSVIGNNVYVYVEGPGQKKAVRLVSSHVSDKVSRKLSFWRHKRIFNFAASEVQNLKLKNKKGRVDLTLKGSDWYLAGNKLAANETVNTFLTGLIHMHAKEYVSDSKSNKDRKKLKMPKRANYQLDVLLKDKRKIKFEVYESGLKNAPKVYATRADKDFIIEIDRTNVEKFKKASQEFRFKRILTAVDKEKLKTVEVGFDKKKFSLAKEEKKGWELKDGKISDFESSRFDKSISTVGSLKIAKFLKKMPKGAKKKSSWKFLDDSGKKIRDVSIYEEAKNQDFYVRFKNGDLALLEKGVGKAVPTGENHFQKNFKPDKGAAKPAPSNVELKKPKKIQDGHGGHSHSHDHGHGHSHGDGHSHH